MAYASRDVAKCVAAMLRTRPSHSLESIAGELKIERHTISRCLRRAYGKSFTEMKSEAIVTALTGLVGNRLMSWKEVAVLCGFSTRTLERWRARVPQVRESDQPIVESRERDATG